jgi:hypothetical protein
LPSSGNTVGDLAYVTANSGLYLWKGSIWFKILTATSPNTTPFFTSQPKASYALATDGTPISLEFTATDPEGTAINWDYSVTDGTLGSIATIVNDSDGSFTITPSTNSSNSGYFELTFTASDGLNIANSRPVRLSLLFNLDWASATLQRTLMAPDVNEAGKFGTSTSTYGYKVAIGEQLYDGTSAYSKSDHGRLTIYDMADMANPVEEFSWSPGEEDSAGAPFNSATTGCGIGEKVILDNNICFAATTTGDVNASGVFVFKYDSAWSFDQFVSCNYTGGQSDFEYDPGTQRLCIAAGNRSFFFHDSDGRYVQKGYIQGPTTVQGVAIKDDFHASVYGSGDDTLCGHWDSVNQQWSEIAQINGANALDTIMCDITKFSNGKYYILAYKNHSAEGTLLATEINTSSLTLGTPINTTRVMINGAGAGANWGNNSQGYRDFIKVYNTGDQLKILGGNGNQSSNKLNLTTWDNTMTLVSDSDVIDYPSHNPASWGANLDWDPVTGIIVTGSPEEDANDGRVYVYRI